MSEKKQQKRSPGPWTYDGESVWDADNCYVCSRVTPGNARVIAAAPDLLRLLREVCDEQNGGLDEYWESQNMAVVAEVRKLIARLDGQPAPVAEPTEKRWFRSHIQIKEYVSRATDGKLNKEAIEVWVSGQPADWTQTIKRADGQIPEWVWESVSHQMVCHAETRFNRQTEMMEFRNWELRDKPAPVAETAEGGT